MNYLWNQKYNKHSAANNFFSIYETTIDGVQIRTHIYITFPILDLKNKRMIHSSVYFRVDNNDYIHNYLHEISDDILELCCNTIESKDELVSFSSNEYYAVNVIPNDIPTTFGDYSF